MSISNYFVDYGAGNDTTGDGTIGTPWKTIQKALDTITRDATNGDQVNIKSGAADVLSASLSLTTYGTPTAAAPLVLRGYASAANDGGMGEIDCGGVTMWASANYDYIHLIDLEIHSPGDNHLIVLRYGISVINCELYKGTSTPSSKSVVRVGANSTVAGCYLHDWPSNLGIVGLGAGVRATSNYINIAAATALYDCTALFNLIINSAILINDSYGNNAIVAGNALWSTTGATTTAITSANVRYGQQIYNNIICNRSGVGGVGINYASAAVHMAGYNAFYNNATDEAGDTKITYVLGGDVALAADPFTDAANGDFSLTTAAKAALRSAGWPASYLGAHANADPHVTIGPMQYGPTPAAGGGGAIRRVMRLLGG